MKNLIFILFFLSFSTHEYPKKFGKPTSQGIEMYVEDYRDSLVIEYQNFINDTIWLDYWIYAEDLTDYVGHDSLELGHYWNGEIVVDMDSLFDAYQLEDLSKFKRRLIGESNRFVKSTIFHELTHHYINQVGREMEYLDSIKIHRSYKTDIWIIRSHDLFGSTFIEEGICEYVVTKMEEIISPKRYYTPKTLTDITNINNRYKVIYKYSSLYLKEFLDTLGLKQGIKILIHNDPPTLEEILNPEFYFDRLQI